MIPTREEPTREALERMSGNTCSNCESNLDNDWMYDGMYGLVCHVCQLVLDIHDAEDCSGCRRAVADHDYDAGRIDFKQWKKALAFVVLIVPYFLIGGAM